MTTTGIHGFLIETHNFGKTVKFWQGMGFALEFETDHGSGQLSHPSGGPWLFVAERPEGHALELQPIVGVADASTFEAPGPVARPFEPQHWDVVEALVVDPDGRRVSVQGPVPAGVEAPRGHG